MRGAEIPAGRPQCRSRLMSPAALSPERRLNSCWGLSLVALVLLVVLGGVPLWGIFDLRNAGS
jgi:hypothetical protein